MDQQQTTIPPRYSTVDPWVISRDTDAEIEFLATVFGAVETPGSRMPGLDGRIGHVEVELGDSVIMMFDAAPEWPATPSHLRVYVADARAVLARALGAGAREVTAPTLLAFGDRVTRFRDRQGHLWWVHEHVEDVPAEQMGQRFADPAATAAMGHVQHTLEAEMASAHHERTTAESTSAR